MLLTYLLVHFLVMSTKILHRLEYATMEMAIFQSVVVSYAKLWLWSTYKLGTKPHRLCAEEVRIIIAINSVHVRTNYVVKAAHSEDEID